MRLTVWASAVYFNTAPCLMLSVSLSEALNYTKISNELDHFSSTSNGLVTSGKGCGLPSPDILLVPKTASTHNVVLQDERSENCRTTSLYPLFYYRYTAISISVVHPNLN
jgi:hypothetical protein